MLKFGKNGGRIMYEIIRVHHFTTTTSASSKACSSTFMVDYLINSLGFSKQEAIAVSSKVRYPFKSPEKPDSVVNFLKTNGFNKTQIRKIVNLSPKILSSKIDKTLKPKLEALKEIGLSDSELANTVSCNPRIFYRSLNGHILPIFNVIKSLFGNSDDDNLILLRALKCSPWILSSNAQEFIPLNVALLQKYGLSMDCIKGLLTERTKYVALHPNWLQGVLIRVEEKLGISRDSAMFFHGVRALCAANEEYVESKFQLYKSLGWTESDILIMVGRNPCALTLSESKIRRSLEFFREELGYQPAEIARRPTLLNFSLEKRVIPRNDILMVLKEKKLIKADFNIFTCLTISNSAFFKRFVLPFKDKVPGLHDDYVRRFGSTLELEADK